MDKLIKVKYTVSGQFHSFAFVICTINNLHIHRLLSLSQLPVSFILNDIFRFADYSCSISFRCAEIIRSFLMHNIRFHVEVITGSMYKHVNT